MVIGILHGDTMGTTRGHLADRMGQSWGHIAECVINQQVLTNKNEGYNGTQWETPDTNTIIIQQKKHGQLIQQLNIVGLPTLQKCDVFRQPYWASLCENG